MNYKNKIDVDTTFDYIVRKSKSNFECLSTKLSEAKTLS